MHPATLRRLAAHAVAVLWSLWLPAICFAQAGAVLATTGGNEIRRIDQLAAEVFAGDAIQTSDTLVTGPGGRMQVRFSDGGIVSLQPRTEFHVEQYRFKKDERRGFFALLRGAIRTATGLIGKQDHQNYRLKTPSATLGIRGTHFVVEQTLCDPACYPGNKAGLRVAVSEGEIVLSNSAGKITVRQGQAAWVADSNSAPQITDIAPTLAPNSIVQPQPGKQLASLQNSRRAAEKRSNDAVNDRDRNDDSGSDAKPNPESTASRDDQEGRDNRGATDRPPGQQAKPSNPQRERSTQGPGDRANGDRHQRWQEDGQDQAFDRNDSSDRAGNPNQPAPTDDQNASAIWDDEPLRAGLPGLPEQLSARRDDDGQWRDLIADGGGSTDGGSGDGGSGDGGDGSSNTASPASGETLATSWRIDLRATPGLSGSGLTADSASIVSFDSNIELQAIGLCPSTRCLTRNTAITVEAGHDDHVAWGRWTDGTITLRTESGDVDSWIAPNQGVHYLVGVPVVTLPTSGTYTYSLSHATSATFNHLLIPAGTFEGQASVQFAPGTASRVGLDATVSIADSSFQFGTQGGASNPALSELSLDPNHRFSGTLQATGGDNIPWMCDGSTCAVNVDGALFGPNGERLGLGYSITSGSGSTTIDGVGVFSRP